MQSKNYQYFPYTGILFKDILPIFEDPILSKRIISSMDNEIFIYNSDEIM